MILDGSPDICRPQLTLLGKGIKDNLFYKGLVVDEVKYNMLGTWHRVWLRVSAPLGDVAGTCFSTLSSTEHWHGKKPTKPQPALLSQEERY